jgi:hypothetical protein
MGHIENDASSNSSTVVCVFVTAVTFLPSHCLATIGGIHRQQRDLISLLCFFKIKKEDRWVWTGFIWLRIRTSGGLLGTR